jgi:hypothetical protein
VNPAETRLTRRRQRKHLSLLRREATGGISRTAVGSLVSLPLPSLLC